MAIRPALSFAILSSKQLPIFQRPGKRQQTWQDITMIEQKGTTNQAEAKQGIGLTGDCLPVVTVVDDFGRLAASHGT